MMKFLALALYLLARITLTLISNSAITGCFQKVNFQEFYLVNETLSCQLHFYMRHVSYSKNRLIYVKIIAFHKNSERLKAIN